MFHPIKDETSTRVDMEKPYYFCCILLMALQKQVHFLCLCSVSSTLHLNPTVGQRAPKNCGAPRTDCAGPVRDNV